MDTIAKYEFGEPLPTGITSRFLIDNVNMGEELGVDVSMKFGHLDGHFTPLRGFTGYEGLRKKYLGKPVTLVAWGPQAYGSGVLKKRIGRSDTWVIRDEIKKSWLPQKIATQAKPLFSRFYFLAVEYGKNSEKLVRVWFAGLPPIELFCEKNKGKHVSDNSFESMQKQICTIYQNEIFRFFKRRYNILGSIKHSSKNPTGVFFECGEDLQPKRRIEVWFRQMDWTSLIVITDLKTEEEERLLEKESGSEKPRIFGDKFEL